MHKIIKSNVFMLAAAGAVAGITGVVLHNDYQEFYKIHLPLGKTFLEHSGFTDIQAGKPELGSTECPKYVWGAQYQAKNPEGESVTQTVCFNTAKGIQLGRAPKDFGFKISEALPAAPQ